MNSETGGVPGMTLRDWFAGQALLGVLPALRTACLDLNAPAGGQNTARICYELADAMLLAREKASPQPVPVRRTYADFEWTPGNQWESLNGPSGTGCETPDTAARRRLGYAGPSYVKFRRAGTHEPVTAERIRAEVEGVR